MNSGRLGGSFAALTLASLMSIATPASSQGVQVDVIEIQTAGGAMVLELDAPMDLDAAEDEVVELVGLADMELAEETLNVVPLVEQPGFVEEPLTDGVAESTTVSSDPIMGDASMASTTSTEPSGWVEGSIDDSAPGDDGAPPAGTTDPPSPDYIPVEGDGGSAKSIFCNIGYTFGDSNGSFSLQRRCGSNKAPWGFKLAPSLQSICINGTVNEPGMRWVRNGQAQSMMAPHTGVYCNYQFHGTFTVSKGDFVSYNDSVKFRHNLGSGGNATVNFGGYVRFRGEKTV